MKLIQTLIPTLAVAVVVLFSACEKKPEVSSAPPAPTSNFETSRLSAAIDAYATNPTAEHAAEVDKAFAELDGEIAELSQRVASTTGAEQKEAQTKSSNLKEFRNKEMMRYTEAQAKATTETIKEEAKDVGESLKEAGQDVGEGLKKAADAVKDGAKDMGESLKEAGQEAGQALKKATDAGKDDEDNVPWNPADADNAPADSAKKKSP